MRLKEKKDMLEILYEVGKVLLTLYLYFISYFYTLSVPLSWTTPVRLIGIYVCVQLVCKWIRKIKIEIKVESDKKNWKFGLAMFGLTFIVMGIYYLAYYPGGLLTDTFNQWYQVEKGYYVDWHPAIHTLLFLKLPSMIINSLAFVNFMDMIWLCLAMGYLGMVLESWGIRKRWCSLILGVSILTPASVIVNSFCWKDTALTIFMIIIVAQLIEIVFSDGRWLDSWLHICVFALWNALASLMRHNAILLTGPLMVLVILLFVKKIGYKCVVSFVLMLLLMGGIKGPVYQVLHVQNHPQVSAEMLGVPMTILGNVLVNDPEALDEEARVFLYKIGNQEMWKSSYTEGSWNSAKYMGDDISDDIIEEEGAENVLRYTWHVIQKRPYLSYRAVVKLFELVLKPAGEHVSWGFNIVVYDGNSYGYKLEGISWIQNILDYSYEGSVNGGVLLTLGWHIGFYVLLLLFWGVSTIRKGWKWILLWIPIICYDFGTALLLCGSDFRFFSFNTVVTLPLLLAMVCSNREERVTGKENEVFDCNSVL